MGSPGGGGPSNGIGCGGSGAATTINDVKKQTISNDNLIGVKVSLGVKI